MPAPMALLALVWALLLSTGLIVGGLEADGLVRAPVWSRIGSSATLAVAAWLWAASESWGTPAVSLIAAGMSLGLAGDLFMARLLPAANRVVPAVAAFGLGHLAYNAAFVLIAGTTGVPPAALIPPWLLWQGIGVAGWWVVVRRGAAASPLRWAALPYTLLLCSIAGLGLALALNLPSMWPLAVGPALFAASDLLIAARIFGRLHFPLIEKVIWLTYGPAQALIVYGLHL